MPIYAFTSNARDFSCLYILPNTFARACLKLSSSTYIYTYTYLTEAVVDVLKETCARKFIAILFVISQTPINMIIDK